MSEPGPQPAERPFISCQLAPGMEMEMETEREAAGLGCSGPARGTLRHMFTGCCSPGSHGASPPVSVLQVLLSVFYGNTTKTRRGL